MSYVIRSGIKNCVSLKKFTYYTYFELSSVISLRWLQLLLYSSSKNNTREIRPSKFFTARLYRELIFLISWWVFFRQKLSDRSINKSFRLLIFPNGEFFILSTKIVRSRLINKSSRSLIFPNGIFTILPNNICRSDWQYQPCVRIGEFVFILSDEFAFILTR